MSKPGGCSGKFIKVFGLCLISINYEQKAGEKEKKLPENSEFIGR